MLHGFQAAKAKILNDNVQDGGAIDHHNKATDWFAIFRNKTARWSRALWPPTF
jgi:hypothetical protein